MEANQNTGATTVDGASQKLTALLKAEPTTPPEEAEHVDEVADVAEQEAEQADPEPPQKYKVQYKGSEEELTLDELIKGNMMERDYRHKTSEVAEQRRALEEKVRKIDETLNDAELLIKEEIANLESPEMKELEMVDPDAYLKELRRVQRKAERFEKRKAERAEHIAEQRRNLAEKERESLLRAIPEWLDNSRFAEEGTKVLGHMRSFGFSDNEINDILDHRMMVMARKAFLFDQISSKDLSSKKVETPPKVAKPGASVDRGSMSTKAIDTAKDKLKQTGNRLDAVNALSAIINKR